MALSTTLPTLYTVDGKEVSREEFEKLGGNLGTTSLGNIDPTTVGITAEDGDEVLLAKTKDAVEKGILNEDNYRDAISATRDNPVVTDYLTSTFPEGLNLERSSSTRKGRREATEEKTRIEQETEAAEVAARIAERGHVITLADILDNPNLQQAGVLSGDRIVDNKLVRVHSSEEDKINIDHVLTQRDIDNNAKFIEAGAEAGDLIIRESDGTLRYVSRGTSDGFKQFMYSKDKSSNSIKNAFDFMEALLPMPTLAVDVDPSTHGSPQAMIAAMANAVDDGVVETVEEKYGETPYSLTYDERRLMVKRRNERRLQAQYGQMFDFVPDSKSAMFGAVTKAVIDPINLIPAASTIKGGVVLGTAISTYGSVTDDLIQSESGEIDTTKALLSATAGAGLSLALLGGGKLIVDRLAHKTVAKAQRALDKGITDGADPAKPLEIIQLAGINPEKLLNAQTRTGTKVHINTKKALDKEAEKIMVTDSAVGRRMNPQVDKVIGAIITRAGNISERVQGRLKKFEWDSSYHTAKALGNAQTWVAAVTALDAPVKKELARLLYNENFDAARTLMGRALADDFDMNILPMLSKLGDDLLESGHSFQKIENYFPRLVTDLKGLQASLGVKQRGIIDKALLAFANSKKVSVDSLTKEENVEIIDNLVRGYSMIKKGDKPSFVRQRKLELTPEQMKFYATPEESLVIYLRRAVNDLEKRKFLGTNISKDSTGRVNYDQSIGNFVEKEYTAGRINMEDQLELVSLLRSRFVGGDQSGNAVVSALRDLGYMGTIANPISAVVQLADLGATSALKGFRNTISTMFGEKKMSIIDLGVEEASAELAEQSVRATANTLRKLLGYTGFRTVDRLGKETYINAAFKRAVNLTKTKKGMAKLRKEMGVQFGDETEDVISSLASGKVDYNTKWYAFNELADVQPITRSSNSEAYLNNPNWRILWMLKSFSLKQIDVVRRKVIGEYQKGNKADAIKQATLLAGYLTTANLATGTITDIMLGREVNVEDVPSKSLWALLGVYGMNKYTTDKYWSQGDWKGGIYQTIVPATPLIDMIIQGVQIPFEEEPAYRKLVTPVPGVGRLFSSWLLGGAETYNERQDDARD